MDIERTRNKKRDLNIYDSFLPGGKRNKSNV